MYFSLLIFKYLSSSVAGTEQVRHEKLLSMRLYSDKRTRRYIAKTREEDKFICMIYPKGSGFREMRVWPWSEKVS